MEKSLSEKESLDLISIMISSARNNLQQGTGKIFLLWGYVIAIIAMLNLIFLQILPPEVNYKAFYFWFATPVGVVIYYLILKKISETKLVTTYIEKVVSYVWSSFAISVFVVVISMLLASYAGGFSDSLHWIQWAFIIPFMLVLYGFALFVSGLAYKFRPLVIGAMICWFSSLFNFLFLGTAFYMEVQLVTLILSVISGYIIPGHLLNRKEKSHV